jgi:D-cysteine desulfhydrase
VGFVNAGLELAGQIERHELAAPDTIFLALGTTGSAAGLALGLAMAGLDSLIEAVMVTPPSMQHELLFARLFAEANKELNARDVHVSLYTEPFAQTNLRADQLGRGYAMPTPRAEAAAGFMREQLNLPASVTYTAKAMAGLRADADKGKLAGKNVLFWNTYNARPYPPLPDDNSWQQLPESMHKYFAG